MQRVCLQLSRKNDAGRMTVRYRWEILWGSNSHDVLVVERYGWKGTKSYCWLINQIEVKDFISDRLSRFNYTTTDIVEMTNNESRPALEIDLMLREWSSENDSDGPFRDKWKAAVARLMYNAAKAAEHSEAKNECVFREVAALGSAYSFSVLNTVVPGLDAALMVSNEMFPPEPEQPKAANWGAW